MRDQDRRIASGTDDGQDVTSIIPPAALSNTLRELRESVEALLDVPAPDVARVVRLRLAIQHLCEGAHEQSVQAEHLIIFVKRAWGRLPSGETLTGESNQVLTLSELVTACIDEFYQSAPTARSGTFLNGHARDSSRAMHDRHHR